MIGTISWALTTGNGRSRSPLSKIHQLGKVVRKDSRIKVGVATEILNGAQSTNNVLVGLTGYHWLQGQIVAKGSVLDILRVLLVRVEFRYRRTRYRVWCQQ